MPLTAGIRDTLARFRDLAARGRLDARDVPSPS
jgi:hypothetical protein